MSNRRPTPAELKAQRDRRRADAAGPAPTVAPEGGGVIVAATEPEPQPVIAQGRPQPMLTLAELPDAIDRPFAEGPLSMDEEERWELCKRGFVQFQQAWFVAAKALDVALRGRLWRRDFDSAEAFIKEVAGMSKSNAYRQIAGAEVAAILANPTPLELESNSQSRMRDSGEASAHEEEEGDESRMRDSGSSSGGVAEDGVPGDPDLAQSPIIVSQRVAEAVKPIRDDYGPQVAADFVRTVVEQSGAPSVSAKVLSGIVSMVPRKADQELGPEELRERAVQIVSGAAPAGDSAPNDGIAALKQFAAYVKVVQAFARDTTGMSEAYRSAAEHDPSQADALARKLARHMKQASANFPDI